MVTPLHWANHKPQTPGQGAGRERCRGTNKSCNQATVAWRPSCLRELLATHGANLPTQEAPGASSLRKRGCSVPSQENTSTIGDHGSCQGTCYSTAHLLSSVRVLLLTSHHFPASNAARVACVTQFWTMEYRGERLNLFTFYLQRVDLMAGAATAT